MELKVGQESEDGTSALVFNVVGKEGIPGTIFRRSIGGDLLLHLHSRDQILFRRRLKVFRPTNVSVEKFVATTYASRVVCLRDEYDSGTENNDDE